MKPLPTVYKYTHREHAEAMINEGKVRLGTLYDYRRQEHGGAIGDTDEGIYKVFSDEDFEYTGPSGASPFHRHFIKGEGHARFQGIRFEHRRVTHNAYMFCCSSEFSESMMQKYRAEPGYDACVRINAPVRFFDEISKVLGREITDWVVGNCVYLKREFHHTQEPDTSPGFVKDPLYAWQKEVRAVWIPKNPENIPAFLDLTCLGIRQFCSHSPPVRRPSRR